MDVVTKPAILNAVYYQAMDVINAAVGFEEFRFTVPYPKFKNDFFTLRRPFDLKVTKSQTTARVSSMSIRSYVKQQVLAGLALAFSDPDRHSDFVSLAINWLPSVRRSELSNRIGQ